MRYSISDLVELIMNLSPPVYFRSEDSLRRWLYKEVEAGRISKCELEEDEAIRVVDRLVDRHIRRDLVRLQIEKKGITPRAARKRIKENLDKGISLKDLRDKICYEVINGMETGLPD